MWWSTSTCRRNIYNNVIHYSTRTMAEKYKVKRSLMNHPLFIYRFLFLDTKERMELYLSVQFSPSSNYISMKMNWDERKKSMKNGNNNRGAIDSQDSQLWVNIPSHYFSLLFFFFTVFFLLLLSDLSARDKFSWLHIKIKARKKDEKKKLFCM